MRQPFGGSKRSLLFLLLAALFASACATTPGSEDPRAHAPQKTETWGEVSAQDLIYPERIGQFSIAETEDYPGAEFGVRLKYTDQSLPRAIIDVYVYPITRQETGSLAHVLEWEMESVAAGIAVVARRNGLRPSEPASFPSGHSTGDFPRGLGVVLMLSSTSEEFKSYAFLSVRDHHFFKLRVTIPNREVELGRDQYLQEVLDVLYPAVHLRSPVPTPALKVTVYADIFRAPQHEVCNLSGWMAYGIELVLQIQRGNYLDTFERERSARKLTLGYWEEIRNDGEFCASDVLEAMHDAKEAGFFDEYVFDAYGRGRWPATEDMDLEEWTRWSKDNLKHHDPMAYPGISVEWKDPEDDASENEGAADTTSSEK